MADKPLNQLTIVEAAQGLRTGSFSSVDLTRSCLEAVDQKDDGLGSFLKVFREESVAQAEEVDRLLAAGQDLPPLAGIPLAIKDSIMIREQRCTAASRILENHVAAYDATVIEKLRQQMAVFIGKTNLDEFSMGASTENSAFQITRNPHDPDRVPGGSSGGSAAAVAAGQALASLGSDTGGSVRQPAAFCGLVGLKPSYGAVSRYGLIAFASSLDQIGPMAKRAEDARLVFRAICGRDPKDATSRERVEQPAKKIAEMKVGFPEQCFERGVSPEILSWLERSISSLKEQGAEVKSIDLPSLMYALPVYHVIAPAEASANLARYDGLRYGRMEGADSLKDIYALTRSTGFGTEVKRRIMLGTYTLSAGHYDAYYQKAQKARKFIQYDFESALKEVDAILLPTTPTVAFRLGEKADDPVAMYLSDLLTTAASLAGLPAVSVPVGREGVNPVGVQLIGRNDSEEFLLNIGSCLEQLGEQ